MNIDYLLRLRALRAIRRALAPVFAAGGAPALKPGVPPKLLPPNPGVGAFVGCCFRKPFEGADAWKPELKPPGLVFSFVFPNENEAPFAGLAD